ncbi:MAG: hypothetical protein K9M96_00890 [Deltaproteobacteria bacterium]|nr:hypothetical protein [Deltaproteobacteria bacterium]
MSIKPMETLVGAQRRQARWGFLRKLRKRRGYLLTIIATIFIPMTFIAGIYGMNFQFMPELKWPWGYPMFWGLVVVIGGVMVLYFKKKKWL